MNLGFTPSSQGQQRSGQRSQGLFGAMGLKMPPQMNRLHRMGQPQGPTVGGMYGSGGLPMAQARPDNSFQRPMPGTPNYQSPFTEQWQNFWSGQQAQNFFGGAMGQQQPGVPQMPGAPGGTPGGGQFGMGQPNPFQKKRPANAAWHQGPKEPGKLYKY